VFAGTGFLGDMPSSGTPEFDNLLKQMAAEESAALEAAPREAHAQRLTSLYVDLHEQGWSRPKETRPGDAYLRIEAAAIEYSKRRSKFLRRDDPQLKTLFATYERWLAALPERATIRPQIRTVHKTGNILSA